MLFRKETLIAQINVNKIWNDLNREYTSESEPFELNIHNKTLNHQIARNKIRNLTFSSNKVSKVFYLYLFYIEYINITILYNFSYINACMI